MNNSIKQSRSVESLDEKTKHISDLIKRKIFPKLMIDSDSSDLNNLNSDDLKESVNFNVEQGKSEQLELEESINSIHSDSDSDLDLSEGGYHKSSGSK
jgi:hypothetical protein